MIDSRRQVHPLARAIPEMLRDEYVELVADIKANGQQQPIVLFEGKILDGVHRERACTELGIEPLTKAFIGSAMKAAAFVLSANVHRRHLTLTQKHEIIAIELKRDPTQSDRAIAKKARVDHKTVATARSTRVARGEIPHVEIRIDEKKRQQPATKRPRPRLESPARNRWAPTSDLDWYRDRILHDVKKLDRESRSKFLRAMIELLRKLESEDELDPAIH